MVSEMDDHRHFPEIESPPGPSTKDYIKQTWKQGYSIVKNFVKILVEPFYAVFQSFWPDALDNNVKPYAIEQYYHPGGDCKAGILLVHGFGAAPDIYKDFIEKLGSLGYVVKTVRIAGHGTSTAHFASTTLVDWYLSVRERFIELKEECEEVVIIAHSLGSLISIILASIYEVKALVFLSPPIKLRDKALYRVNFMLRPVSKLVKYWPTDKEGLRHVEKHGFKIYDKHPLSAVANLIDMIEMANRRLPKVTAPILAIIGDRDEFAETNVLDIIEENAGSQIVEKWVAKGAPHAIIECADFETLKDKLKTFILTYCPPRRVGAKTTRKQESIKS